MFTRGQWKCFFILHFSAPHNSEHGAWMMKKRHIACAASVLWFDHFRLNQISYTSTSCKGYGLQRYFLKRTESEVKVPEREIFWNDSSWEGSGLRRQFLRRIRSEKTVPAKERVWNDNSWEGSGLRRQFLKRINSSIFNLSPINVPR